MKLYLATANCDWGVIYTNEEIKASQWQTAFNRAGYLAKVRARRKPKEIGIRIRFVSTIKKFGGLPADETTPEQPS